MAVYVDPLFTMQAQGQSTFAVGERNGHRWCHLFADTVEELQAFAKRLGLNPKWFQHDLEDGHYDLTPDKRERAVQLGAKECTRAEAVAIWRRLKARKILRTGREKGIPDDAIVRQIRALSDGTAREIEAVIAAERGSAPLPEGWDAS